MELIKVFGSNYKVYSFRFCYMKKSKTLEIVIMIFFYFNFLFCLSISKQTFFFIVLRLAAWVNDTVVLYKTLFISLSPDAPFMSINMPSGLPAKNGHLLLITRPIFSNFNFSFLSLFNSNDYFTSANSFLPFKVAVKYTSYY